MSSEFPWGEIIREHHISGFTIIEHHPWKERGNEILGGKPNMKRRAFHVEEQSRGFDTLDKALIGAICYRYGGCNERLSGYIFKALDGMRPGHKKE